MDIELTAPRTTRTDQYMRSTPRKRDGEASREKILQVATELFSQKGYAASGVDEIAARANIAKTALYYHFGNKQGILAAVLERLATEWIERIQHVSLQVASPMDRLDRALAGMRAMVEERPDILKLFQIMALEVAEHKPDVRRTLQSIGKRAREALSDGLREAFPFELNDADAIARVVLALLISLVTAKQIEDSPLPLDNVFDEIRRLVIMMVAVRVHPSGLQFFEDQIRAAASVPVQQP